MAKQFNLGETESVLVEGKDIKMLCMSLGENRISVFMDKSANSCLDYKANFTLTNPSVHNKNPLTYHFKVAHTIFTCINFYAEHMVLE